MQRLFELPTDLNVQNRLISKLIKILKEGLHTELDDYPRLLASFYELEYLKNTQLDRFVAAELKSNFQAFSSKIDVSNTCRILQMIANKKTLNQTDLDLIDNLLCFLDDLCVFLSISDLNTLLASHTNILNHQNTLSKNSGISFAQEKLALIILRKFRVIQRSQTEGTVQNLPLLY